MSITEPATQTGDNSSQPSTSADTAALERWASFEQQVRSCHRGPRTQVRGFWEPVLRVGLCVTRHG